LFFFSFLHLFAFLFLVYGLTLFLSFLNMILRNTAFIARLSIWERTKTNTMVEKKKKKSKIKIQGKKKNQSSKPKKRIISHKVAASERKS